MIKPLTLTDNIALYAAVLSTIIFIWGLYKHFTKGAKLLVSVSKNRTIVPDPIEKGKLWVGVSVVNKGDQTATITNTHYVIYKSYLSKLFGKATQVYDVPNPWSPQPLPVVILPGEMWRGWIAQEVKSLKINLNDESIKNIVMIQVSVAHRKNTINKRLR